MPPFLTLLNLQAPPPASSRPTSIPPPPHSGAKAITLDRPAGGTIPLQHLPGLPATLGTQPSSGPASGASRNRDTTSAFDLTSATLPGPHTHCSCHQPR